MSFDVLKDELKSSKVRNIYLFYGPEEYLKKYYADYIENMLLKEDMKALNKIVLDGKVEVRKIMDASETYPVFSDKKLVIVKNSGLFKPKKKAGNEGNKKTPNDDFGVYLQSIPDYTCLVFFEEEIDKRIKLVDTVKKNGLIVEFAYQKPAELVKWVIKVFKSFNKEIDPMTASQLVEYGEQGMTELLSEINKVVLFLGDKTKANSSDIEKVCIKSIKSRIFDLTDAIAEKNSVKALKLLDDMVLLKEPLPKILFMITRQFRLILEMKLLKGEGASPNEAASKLGITPYAAGKILKHVGSFTVDVLKEALEESLQLDLAIKTGKMNDRIAAELLIAQFSA